MLKILCSIIVFYSSIFGRLLLNPDDFTQDKVYYKYDGIGNVDGYLNLQETIKMLQTNPMYFGMKGRAIIFYMPSRYSVKIREEVISIYYTHGINQYVEYSCDINQYAEFIEDKDFIKSYNAHKFDGLEVLTTSEGYQAYVAYKILEVSQISWSISISISIRKDNCKLCYKYLRLR